LVNHILRLCATTALLVAIGTSARADVCVTIDHSADTLKPDEQSVARLLLSKQFEQEGERVVAAGCANAYVLGHAELGNIIMVTLSGPKGRREAMAKSKDDLPALYSQMVRSIVSGRPMTGFNVVDRANVTESQASARRVHSDSLWYARLGYGSVFGDRTYATPSLGFGYRAELDSFGLDVSFLNFQFRGSNGYYSPGATTMSPLKLSGLYFFSPRTNRSAYVGGGLSYGRTSFSDGGGSDFATTFTTNWQGSGLQGELTAGYELARVTKMRIFVQADAVLPFYDVSSTTYSRSGRVTTTNRRHAPSMVFSLGLGR
jgi:hypothetical protein